MSYYELQYYFFYHSGVVPAIVLIAALNMVLTVGYSYRRYPLRLRFSRRHLRDGYGMIRLGVAFVLAAEDVDFRRIFEN